MVNSTFQFPVFLDSGFMKLFSVFYLKFQVCLCFCFFLQGAYAKVFLGMNSNGLLVAIKRVDVTASPRQQEGSERNLDAVYSYTNIPKTKETMFYLSNIYCTKGFDAKIPDEL